MEFESAEKPIFYCLCAKTTKDFSLFKNATVNCDIFDKKRFLRLTYL
jgi:hypothetical protein